MVVNVGVNNSSAAAVLTAKPVFLLESNYPVASHNFRKKEVKFPWIGNTVMTDFHHISIGASKAFGVWEAET